MPEYLRPGVFAEELPSQVQPIEGVGTTTGSFIGITEKGPLDTPTLITGWEGFKRIFGGHFVDPIYGVARLAYEVLGFFQNGGKRCYVTRVAHRISGVQQAAKASKAFNDEQTSPETALTVYGKTEGAHGNNVSVAIEDNPKGNTNLYAAVQSTDTEIQVNSAFGFKAGSEIKIASSSAATIVYAQVTKVTIASPAILTLASAVGQEFLPGDNVVTEEFDLIVYVNDVQEKRWEQVSIVESYSGAQNADFVESKVNDELFGSDYISVTVNDANTATYERRPTAVTVQDLTGGDNGLSDGSSPYDMTLDLIGDSSIPSGLQSMTPIDEINLICIPEEQSADIADALNTFVTVTRADVFAYNTVPSGYTVSGAATYRRDTPGFTHHKMRLDFPWLEINDPIGAGRNAKIYTPGDGYRMGAQVRVDLSRGVFHGGFGFEAQLKGVSGFQVDVDDRSQEILNPLSVNVSRNKSGRGNAIWGGRTCYLWPEFRYQSVVRTMMFFEESIRDSLGWSVGEPNDERLWERLRINIEAFLIERWREGYLQGTKPSEAFFVNADENNNTEASKNEGRVIVDIGVAIVKPAEFVILRFINWDGGRLVEELGLAG